MVQNHREPPLCFGDFTVDTAARTLHKFGRRLKLHRQPFEILLMLIARPGDVIRRDELQAKLWSEDTFVDFENRLNAAVKKLRQTLGDSATDPRFIKTVPRVGYRFIAQVEVKHPSPAPSPAEAPPETAPPSASFPRFVARRKWWMRSAGVACVALLAFAAVRFLHVGYHRVATTAQTRTMLAVLPFENLTGDATEEYLDSCVGAKQFDEARKDIDRSLPLENQPEIWSQVHEAYIYNRSGNLPQARRLPIGFEHANLQNRNDPGSVSLSILAAIAAGQRDQFFAALQKAFLQRSNTMTGLKVDPLYDPYRSDPRFQDLLRRVGLAN